jgi:MSHA biogenesis protein MshN
VPVAAPAATIEPVSAPQSLRMADALSVMPPPAVETTRKATVAPKASERQPTPVIPPRQSVAAVVSKVPPVGAEGRIDKQERLPSPAERAETEYRRAVQAQRQGNLDQAAAGYRAVLEDHPEHPAARQALAGLLIEARRFDEAEEVLRKGTELAPVRLASILALARLKVERNQAPAALELLQKNAAAGESSAEYQGFAGALLNRAGRAAEAVERYQAAVRLAPGEARWWAGLGIALDSAGRTVEAREAYQKARALPGLPADLAQHIDQRLR